MMNNLQKNLQENVEKYNGNHHLYKRVKVINCYHCYPISIEIDEVGNNIEQILIFRNNFEEKNIKTPGNSSSTSRSESPKIIRKFKSKYSKSPKSPRTPKSEEEKEKASENKEFPLIQLYDLEIETESSSTNKPEETENTLFDLHKILENIFNNPFSSEFNDNQQQTESPKKSEETNSSEEDSSDSEIENNDSEFELNINILLEPENLENIKNLIEIDVKQFAEALKDAGLSQKLVES